MLVNLFYNYKGVTDRKVFKEKESRFFMKTQHYTRGDFEDFMDGIKRASSVVRTLSPDIYMVSLNGGQPLFDLLTVSDRDIDPLLAVYFPMSSKIKNSAKVAERCFTNLFLERQHQGQDQPQVIVSLDEVVSGGSVDKILNAYDSATRIVAKYNIGRHDRGEISKEARSLAQQFPLKIIGMKETRDGVRFAKKYCGHVNKGRVHEVPVRRILTMDDPDMHIPSFDHPTSSGWNGQGYFPTVGDLKITTKYLEFLQEAARYFGVDPSTVSPQGIARIREHSTRYSAKPDFSR
jgi:hypothetical protein